MMLTSRLFRRRTAPGVSRMMGAGGMVKLICCGGVLGMVSVNTMVPAVLPVWKAMLDCVPNMATVSPGEIVTVAERVGPERNWTAASFVTPPTLGWNAMVSVPKSVTWEGAANRIDTLFC